MLFRLGSHTGNRYNQLYINPDLYFVMFNKPRKISSTALLILIATIGYLSIFMLLLNRIIETTGIQYSFILVSVSLILIIISCFITWGIFNLNLNSSSHFWLFFLLFGIYLLISYFIFKQTTAHLIGFSLSLLTKTYIFLLVFQIVIGIPTAFHLLNRLFVKLKKSNEEIEIRKIELENLKNQLSPHFLFNHLNNIYATIMIDKEIALDYTHKFSDMMRFYHNMIGLDFIPLNDELNYIENYLALEKYKMGDRLRLSFVKHIDELKYQIPPFLLTPFIETAIERSQGLGALPYIEIILTIQNGTLKLDVINSIPEKPGKVKKQILLDKLKSQLQFLYPDRFTLKSVKINNMEQSTLEFPL